MLTRDGSFRVDKGLLATKTALLLRLVGGDAAKPSVVARFKLD